MTKPEFMKNADGHLVPIEKVKPQDILEDNLVQKLTTQACALRELLVNFKKGSFTDVQEHLDQLATKYGAKRGGKKGNITLTSFDGLTRVQISVADFIQFGPQLQVAKNLIDESIKDWNRNGGNENIVTLVNHAFRVDKEGQVNRSAILGLRRVNIKGAKWERAMAAIADSIKVTKSKQYIRFSQRETPESAWTSITLDIAAV